MRERGGGGRLKSPFQLPIEVMRCIASYITARVRVEGCVCVCALAVISDKDKLACCSRFNIHDNHFRQTSVNRLICQH